MLPTPATLSPPLSDHTTVATLPLFSVAVKRCAAEPRRLVQLQPVQLVSICEVSGEIEKTLFAGVAVRHSHRTRSSPKQPKLARPAHRTCVRLAQPCLSARETEVIHPSYFAPHWSNRFHLKQSGSESPTAKLSNLKVIARAARQPPQRRENCGSEFKPGHLLKQITPGGYSLDRGVTRQPVSNPTIRATLWERGRNRLRLDGFSCSSGSRPV